MCIAYLCHLQPREELTGYVMASVTPDVVTDQIAVTHVGKCRSVVPYVIIIGIRMTRGIRLTGISRKAVYSHRLVCRFRGQRNHLQGKLFCMVWPLQKLTSVLFLLPSEEFSSGKRVNCRLWQQQAGVIMIRGVRHNPACSVQNRQGRIVFFITKSAISLQCGSRLIHLQSLLAKAAGPAREPLQGNGLVVCFDIVGLFAHTYGGGRACARSVAFRDQQHRTSG